MPNYADGKIYQLDCEDGYFYIGSTCSPLTQRLSEHKRHSKLYPNLKRHSKPILGITLLKSYPCSSRKELLKEEDTLIRSNLLNPKCLNELGSSLNIENRTNYMRVYGDAYYENNKEKILERCKLRYETNKDILNEKHTCEICGGHYTTVNYNKHIKTPKHISKT
jgi:predicted GIY-YIG superfamily endonuclease